MSSFSKRDGRVRCPYCPSSTELVEDCSAGDLVCSGCGLVLGDRIVDVGAEWRTFSNDTMLNKSRVGAEESILYDGMDLSTMVGQSGPSAVAYDESGERKYRNKKFLTSTQRTLVSGFKEIAEMAEKLNAARPVVESAQLVFKKIQTKQALKGRGNEAIAAACLFVAYRNNNVPRTFKEICAVAKASKKEIGRCFKVISQTVQEMIIPLPSTVDYIPRFCAQLGLSTQSEQKVRKLILELEKLGVLAGRTPATIIGLAITMVSSLNKFNPPPLAEEGLVHRKASAYPLNGGAGLSMKNISEATGAGVGTIHEAFDLVKNNAADHFPEYFPLLEKPMTIAIPCAREVEVLTKKIELVKEDHVQNK